MPPRPAQSSSECIFCVHRHIFFHPSSVRPATRPQSRARQTRKFTRLQERPRGHEKPIRNSTGPKKTVLGIRRDDGSGFRNQKVLKFGSRNESSRHEGVNEYAVTKLTRSRPEPANIKDVVAAICKQLQALKQRVEGDLVADGDPLTNVVPLDPDRARWKNFETETLLILEEGTKQARVRSLSTEQWDFYRELFQAQTARQVISLPEPEVLKILEFAYIDLVLQTNQQSKDQPFDPIAECTDLRYPTEWYANARSTQRQIHLHVGPTNSGKTYNALKRLEETGDGYYCGPLRLLAHEVYSRFRAKGMPCHLITGDDVRTDAAGEETKLRSSTVEMVDTNIRVEVAVIDEIQMMAHENRGWAWTRAFLGANAKEVHLCGETRVVPLVRELAASMGDTLHIHNYERLSPLKVMSKSLKGNLRLLRKGDCVVSFSVLGIHALKKEIEKETGRRVAIVYGSLPPETRAAQAELFNNPDNDYDFLVASDAIGMGLNLAVRRIVFETVYKFNGRQRELLSVPQIKQIAGRAGRYRTAKQGAEEEIVENSKTAHNAQVVGLVTCMEEEDLITIQRALETEPQPIKAAGLLPPSEFVEEYAARLPKGLPYEYIYRRVCDAAKMHPRFMLMDVSSQMRIAKVLDSVPELTTPDRIKFAASPVEAKKPQDISLLAALGKCVADGRPVTCVEIPEIPLEILDEPISGQREYLHGLEMLHKALILYSWLSYRFVAIFKDQAQAMYAKSLTEQKINETLQNFSHVADLKERMRQLRKRHIKDSKILSELDAQDPAFQGIGLESGTTEPDVETSFRRLPTLELNKAEPSTKDLIVDPPGLDLRLEPSDLPTSSLRHGL